jgi:hypothetical protein
MIKRIAIALAVLAVLAWVVSRFGAHVSSTHASSSTWPLGLGPLDGVPKRYPVRGLSDAADRLIDLAGEAGIDMNSPPERRREPEPVRQHVADYVRTELERADDHVGPPPPDVAAYLHEREMKIGEIRQLLTSGAKVVWPADIGRLSRAPLPNLLGQMYLARLFTAQALDVLARGGDQQIASEDLHAVWRLSQSVWGRPELISSLIALAQARMANAAVRKLDLRPSWFGELERFDVRRSVLTSQQAEAWSMRSRYESTAVEEEGSSNDAAREQTRNWIVDIVAKPYLVAGAASFASSMREVAGRAATNRRCAASAVDEWRVGTGGQQWFRGGGFSMPNLTSVWQRVGRFRAERELTARILEVKSGASASSQSECADGRWVYEGSRIRFSAPLDVGRPQFAVPLAYEVTAARR